MGTFKLVDLLDEATTIVFDVADGFVFRGEYDNGTSYVLGDVVNYNGSSYVAYQATTGNLPTDNSYWYLLAEKGDTGDTGLHGQSANLVVNPSFEDPVFSNGWDLGAGVQEKSVVWHGSNSLKISASGSVPAPALSDPMLVLASSGVTYLVSLEIKTTMTTGFGVVRLNYYSDVAGTVECSPTASEYVTVTGTVDWARQAHLMALSGQDLTLPADCLSVRFQVGFEDTDNLLIGDATGTLYVDAFQLQVVSPADVNTPFNYGVGRQGDNGLVSINTQTDNYSLVLTDLNKIVEINSGTSKTLTIPTNASVAFDIGTRVAIRQAGTGTVTIAGDVGVTVQSESSAFDLAGQYAMAMLFKIDTNTWALEGNVV